ncbi:MAG: Lrp/AsnC family transcriptional regulator [Candidatus Micrarchaeota archaeon]|nr:Lrp/AsnC family transcriptional regulator [Candidatus Micrarchaeota archaeon]
MKDIRRRLIELFKNGYCTPRIARIARELQEPSTTIHYNIKRMEIEGLTKAYKAVFDYKKIGEGFCTYVLISLSPDEYGNPERVGRELVRFPQIESIDIITGDWEMLLKVRTKDIEEYYEFVKKALSKKGIVKTKSLSSLRQLKTEFVKVD